MIVVGHFHFSSLIQHLQYLQAHPAFLSLQPSSTLISHTHSILYNGVCKCIALAYHSVLFPWLGGSCHALKIRAVKSRSFYIEVTYSVTISACSGSDQASAVGCKGVVKAPWLLFLLDSTIPGGLMMVKLEHIKKFWPKTDIGLGSVNDTCLCCVRCKIVGMWLLLELLY